MLPNAQSIMRKNSGINASSSLASCVFLSRLRVPSPENKTHIWGNIQKQRSLIMNFAYDFQSNQVEQWMFVHYPDVVFSRDDARMVVSKRILAQWNVLHVDDAHPAVGLAQVAYQLVQLHVGITDRIVAMSAWRVMSVTTSDNRTTLPAESTYSAMHATLRGTIKTASPRKFRDPCGKSPR